MTKQFYLKWIGAGLALSVLGAGTAHAAPLTNVTFTVADNRTFAVTTATIGFTTATALDAPATTYNAPTVKLPSGFTLNTDTNCTGVTMAVNGVGRIPSFCSLGASGPESIGVQTNVPIAAGSVVVVSIPVTNPSTGGVKTTGLFWTSAAPGNNSIDAPAAQPSVTIVAPPPIPTLSEWAIILFGFILAGGAALMIQRRRLTA